MVSFWDVDDCCVCSTFTGATPLEDLTSHHHDLAMLLDRVEQTITCGGRKLHTKLAQKKKPVEESPVKLNERVYMVSRSGSRLSPKQQESRVDEEAKEAETHGSTVDQEVRQATLYIDADNHVVKVDKENKRHIQENGFETVWMYLGNLEPVEKQMSRIRSFGRKLLWSKAGKEAQNVESRSTDASLARTCSEESPLTLCHVVDRVLDDDTTTEIEKERVDAIFHKEMDEWFIQDRNKCDTGFDLSARSVRSICRDAILRSTKGTRTSRTPLFINHLHMKTTAKIRSFATGKMKRSSSKLVKTYANCEEYEDIISSMEKTICDEKIECVTIDPIFTTSGMNAKDYVGLVEK